MTHVVRVRKPPFFEMGTRRQYIMRTFSGLRHKKIVDNKKFQLFLNASLKAFESAIDTRGFPPMTKKALIFSGMLSGTQVTTPK